MLSPVAYAEILKRGASASDVSELVSCVLASLLITDGGLGAEPGSSDLRR